ncbi:LysR family transcriptional regulator [Rhodanobacter sp. MP7CTX1]|uniref:LysR family transcriptional regulator n=1 Tax=Rhodanobacter sp. MP7CTX1 TaxID=2723084 RepID=UPI0017BE5C5C|nr:DNA-binding transcriptional LysR family regulator [Rhodanobacter sp. MP7CTX1]
MDRFEAMTILLAAVDTGSLSAASRQLHIPLATVSRRVSELEEHLQVRLLLRGTRKLTLTDAGSDYVTSCRRIMEDIVEAERTATGEYRAPQGELIISAPQVIGRHHVVPVLVEFLHAYPEIRARIQLSDRVANLLEEHVDVAVRVGELPDSDMIATRIALISRVLCAGPAYLKSRGMPKEPIDLASHDCITYDGYSAADKWEFRSGQTSQVVQVSSRLTVNSAEAAVIAAIADAGIARVLSDQIFDPLKSGVLVRLLEAFEPTPMPASLVYPKQRHVPLKLRAFLDFVTPRLRERLGYKNS